MSNEPLCLKRLYIKEYKNIKDFSIEPESSPCTVRIKDIAGAEAICEFIVSALYDENFPDGSLCLKQGEAELSVTSDNGEKSLENNGFAIILPSTQNRSR